MDKGVRNSELLFLRKDAHAFASDRDGMTEVLWNTNHSPECFQADFHFLQGVVEPKRKTYGPGGISTEGFMGNGCTVKTYSCLNAVFLLQVKRSFRRILITYHQRYHRKLWKTIGQRALGC